MAEIGFVAAYGRGGREKSSWIGRLQEQRMANNDSTDIRRLEAQDAAPDAPIIPFGRVLEEILLEGIAFLDDPANAGDNTLMRIHRGLNVGQQLFLRIQGLDMNPWYRLMLNRLIHMLGFAKCVILGCILVCRF
ncbi:uncharacterized protein LOC120294673 [Eucalyptus grandis]|uniref:uncharacterized protein LOC120294673 n=1 Tax=Eucalyptus grandis TaxID=71139 RepID=UPI00192F057E|nr:uncharacterized protein LOC120294673 [Eucalyptus grandis]